MIRKAVFVMLLAFGLAADASAQDPRDLSIRTFTLRNLRPEDAAKLLGPYVTSPGGGVFEAGSVGAITVRETFTTLTLIDSLLRTHDKTRAVVSMRFKLIAALDSSMRDPAIEDIDAELRKLFRFRGYELIGEGTMLSEESTDFMTTLSTKAVPVARGKGTGRAHRSSDGVAGRRKQQCRAAANRPDAGDRSDGHPGQCEAVRHCRFAWCIDPRRPAGDCALGTDVAGNASGNQPRALVSARPLKAHRAGFTTAMDAFWCKSYHA
jgi:hypothetical protein